MYTKYVGLALKYDLDNWVTDKYIVLDAHSCGALQFYWEIIWMNGSSVQLFYASLQGYAI